MDPKILLRKLEREVKARKAAEGILEKKALELFQTNEELKGLNETLEHEIELRTAKMISADKKYRDLVETIDEVIYHADLKGNFIFMNQNGPARFGFKHEEMLEAHYSKFVHPDDIEETRNFYRNMMLKDKDNSYLQFRIISKDGQIRWIGQSVKAVREAGKIVKFAAVARDITERKKLIDDLNDAKELAESAQKAEKQFLANMSHEIRTPLNAIIGMSHLLTDTKLDIDQSEYVDVLLSSSKILHSLISDVLDISKIDAGHIEIQEKEFDLISLLKILEKTFAVKLETKAIEMKLDIEEGIETMLIGDELLLNQVFFNLLGNAEKFTEQGNIFLKVRIIENTKEYVKLNFEVKDTGIGIPRNKVNDIFEKFKQVSENKKFKYGGTGLGLPITKKIINLMEGDLAVESIEGLGSVFHFELVFKNTGKPIVDQVEFDINSDSFKQPTFPILVVEDNPLNQKYIGRLLSKWAFKFEFANHGKEAVQKCNEKEYALIFMDIQMPIMDGIEAAKNIRNTNNLNQITPIIALTASSLLSIKDETKQIGMDDFLSKPFTPLELQIALSKYFATKAHQDAAHEGSEATFRFNNQLDKDYIEENYGDDLVYTLDMFETFLDSFEKDHAILQQGILDKDIETCARYCHKIKPMFTIVGLNHITDHFGSLESFSKGNNWEGFITFYNKVDKEIVGAYDLINGEVGRLRQHLSVER